MSSQSIQPRQFDSTRITNVAVVVLVVGMAAVVMWLTLSLYRAFQAAESLMNRQARVEQMLDGGLNAIDADELGVAIDGINDDVAELRAAVGPLLPIAPYLGWLPRIGPLIVAGPHLMDMAEIGSIAAQDIYPALKPAIGLVSEPNDGGSLLPPLAATLMDAQSELAQANVYLDQIALSRNLIDNEAELPWRVTSLLQLFDREFPLLEDLIIMAQATPEMLGMNGPRTYLLMAQNEDELRATGGFLAGAGIISVDNGQIVTISFQDASVVDDWLNKPYGMPPDPYNEFMGMDLFLFRDANFWPDFPTSAEQAMSLYTYGQEIALDGAIAIDQMFLRMLLASVGPVSIEELGITASPSSVIEQIRREWGPQSDEEDWIRERNDFMEPIARALFAKLTVNTASTDWLSLIRTLENAVDRKHLQIYMRDPDTAALLAASGWDGRLSLLPNEDHVFIVETNVGFNKASAIVDRALQYDVSLNEAGSGNASFTVTYFHTGENDGTPCLHELTPYTRELRYQELIDRCYWNYLRLYVPAGSELLDAQSRAEDSSRFLSGNSWLGQARIVPTTASEWTIFDNFILLRKAETTSLSFQYELPAIATQDDTGRWHYRLTVGKQAGINEQEVRISIKLPPATDLVMADPEPETFDAGIIKYDLNQTADLTIDVHFE